MSITKGLILCRIACRQEGSTYRKVKGILMPMKNSLVACTKSAEKRIVSPLLSKLDIIETKLSRRMLPYLASVGMRQQLPPQTNAQKRHVILDNGIQHGSFSYKIRIVVYSIDVL